MFLRHFLTVTLFSLSICLQAQVADSLRRVAENSSGYESLEAWYNFGVYQKSVNPDDLLLAAKNIEALSVADTSFRAVMLRASAYYSQAKYDQALKTCKESEKKALRANNERALVDLRHTRGIVYLIQGSYSIAESLAEQNLQLADSIDYLDGQGNSRLLLGNIYNKKGEPELALKQAELALRLYSEMNDESGIATSYKLIGNTHLYKGDYAKALEVYLKAAKLQSDPNEISELASIYVNIGVIHEELGNISQSESYLLKSKQIRQDLGDYSGTAGTLISLGNLWVETRPTRAKSYYDEALQIYSQNGELNGYAQALNNVGNTFYWSGDYEQSLEYSLLALEINEKTQNQHEIALVYNNIGYSYMKLKQRDKAISYFTQSLKKSREINDKTLIGNALIGLGDGYEEFGEFENAVKYRNNYILFKDSIISENTAIKVQELEAKYESEIKEQQINLLTRERELQEIKIERQEAQIIKQRSQIVFFISFLFMFLLAGYGSYRRLRLKKQKEIQEVIISEQRKGLKAVINATETERKRIARDLHDGVAQTLSGLHLAFNKFWSEIKFDSRMQEERFKQSVEYLDEACAEIRSLSHQMIPSALLKLGIIPAIDDMLSKSISHSSLRYSFEYFGIKREERLDEKFEINIFRIAQELVNNVIKHSGAKNVRIQLIRDKDELVFMVEDDGVGIEAEDLEKGIGLTNIKGRIHSLDGSLSMEKGTKNGLLVTIRIPVSSDEAN